ncbi:hypothetical protein NKH18_40540 [Streptomyces sp. M10(2022)]
MPISASVRSHGARTGTAAAAVLAAAGLALAGAPAAFAAPGDSGDLSVQSADHSRAKHRAGTPPSRSASSSSSRRTSRPFRSSRG